MESNDFVVSELLKELKEGNARKDKQIHKLYQIIVAIVLAAFLLVFAMAGVFIWYLNQYDFTSTSTYSAEGTYALIDSNGNALGYDISAEELQRVLEVLNIGESDSYPD